MGVARPMAPPRDPRRRHHDHTADPAVGDMPSRVSPSRDVKMTVSVCNATVSRRITSTRGPPASGGVEGRRGGESFFDPGLPPADLIDGDLLATLAWALGRRAPSAPMRHYRTLHDTTHSLASRYFLRSFFFNFRMPPDRLFFCFVRNAMPCLFAMGNTDRPWKAGRGPGRFACCSGIGRSRGEQVASSFGAVTGG